MGANDWIEDVESSEEDGEDDAPSLFEENFEKMVDDGDIGGLALQTLENQVDRIDSEDLLESAIEQDDREDAEEIYRDRLAQISEDGGEVGDEGAEEADEADGSEVEDEGGEADEADGSDEESVETEQEDAEEDVAEEDADPGEEDEDPESDVSDVSGDTSDLPEVDVSSLAPNAVSREEAAEADPQRTLLVWGPEGAGKSHLAHSAPEPIAYIDTEGKAAELAEKFDKEIVYWEADDYDEAKTALDEALELLDAYLEQGVRGTLVVDSMTKMWEYAKVDYAEFAYQTDDLSEVNFQSQLEGEKDWTQIKARHNEQFRQVILDSPFHVVFTSGQKEDYNAVFDGGGKKMIPDGEKWNKYAVKDVVRLRRDDQGRTVADLSKSAKTRYSFIGLRWPEWGDIYGAIERIFEAVQAQEEVDVDVWEFDVTDGQPIQEPADGSDGGEEDDG